MEVKMKVKKKVNHNIYAAPIIGIALYVFLYATCMSTLYDMQKNQKKNCVGDW